MPEIKLRHHVRFHQQPPCTRYVLRSRPGNAQIEAACQTVLGVGLPTPGLSHDSALVRILWCGPDSWLIEAKSDHADGLFSDLGGALSGCQAALIDVSAAWSVVCITDPEAPALLARGCPLDLSFPVFPHHRCTRTVLGPFSVLLRACPADIPSFDIYVARSYGNALWRWLDDVIEPA